MRTENTVCLRISDKFYQSLRILVRDGARVRPEGEPPNPHIHALRFGFIFANTNTGELGICVNNSRNRIIVHVTGLAGEILHACDPFLLGLVRQHRPSNDVANGVDAFHVRAEMFVDFDPLPFVKLDADFLRTDSFA